MTISISYCSICYEMSDKNLEKKLGSCFEILRMVEDQEQLMKKHETFGPLLYEGFTACASKLTLMLKEIYDLEMEHMMWMRRISDRYLSPESSSSSAPILPSNASTLLQAQLRSSQNALISSNITSQLPSPSASSSNSAPTLQSPLPSSGSSSALISTNITSQLPSPSASSSNSALTLQSPLPSSKKQKTTKRQQTMSYDTCSILAPLQQQKSATAQRQFIPSSSIFPPSSLSIPLTQKVAKRKPTRKRKQTKSPKQPADQIQQSGGASSSNLSTDVRSSTLPLSSLAASSLLPQHELLAIWEGEEEEEDDPEAEEKLAKLIKLGKNRRKSPRIKKKPKHDEYTYDDDDKS